MRLKNEQLLLNQGVRAELIEEIKGAENQARKAEAFRRYQIYKDRSSDYVRQMMQKQFDQATIDQMAYATANVSLVRKAIDKLARVYANGAVRSVGSEEAGQAVTDLARVLGLDVEMKKTNRFLKLQKNCAFYVKPCPVETPDGMRWTLQLLPLNPYLYDVVEDYYRRTEPMAYILSSYQPQTLQYSTVDAATAGRGGQTQPAQTRRGDGQDQAIADAAEDDGAKDERYIVWSKSFHFTMNGKGEIVASAHEDGTIAGVENPIQMLPIINFAIDQDGSFWATGGEDLIDGALVVNSMLTHLNHVAVTQGYGQFWMSGKKLPRGITVGPSKAILMEYEDGEPEPKLGFASAGPELDSMRNLIEMYVALLLTTNNLSTSGVATQLAGSVSAPSGIALMIDKAESREDVADQEQLFLDKEPKIWAVIAEWMKTYGESLVDEFKQVKLPDLTALKVQFNPAQVIMSETEKLDILAKRQELGLDTEIDTIMKDNPALSRPEAEAKLKVMLEEKMRRQAEAMEQREALGYGESGDAYEGEGDGAEDAPKPKGKGKRKPPAGLNEATPE
jgi:hypothetical protein